DATGMPYCQGFGWVDVDGDGINDAFTDVDGDGVNDRDGHHYDSGFTPDPYDHGHGGMMDPGDWPGPEHHGGTGMGMRG
ncbi:MAG: hypothetical protein ACYTGV_11840, partial [Planctomycetota bacterium]